MLRVVLLCEVFILVYVSKDRKFWSLFCEIEIGISDYRLFSCDTTCIVLCVNRERKTDFFIKYWDPEERLPFFLTICFSSCDEKQSCEPGKGYFPA